MADSLISTFLISFFKQIYGSHLESNLLLSVHELVVHGSLLTQNPISFGANLAPSKVNVGGVGESAADDKADHCSARDLCANHVNLSALLCIHQQTLCVLVGSLQ